MCLDMRFKPEVEKKMIAKLPDGLITAYRSVRKRNSYYIALWRKTRFCVGLNHACTDQQISCGPRSYQAGYHSFVTKHGLRKYARNPFAEEVLVTSQIRKEWITAIGKQGGCIVYVTDRIISPSLRDKPAVVE